MIGAGFYLVRAEPGFVCTRTPPPPKARPTPTGTRPVRGSSWGLPDHGPVGCNPGPTEPKATGPSPRIPALASGFAPPRSRPRTPAVNSPAPAFPCNEIRVTSSGRRGVGLLWSPLVAQAEKAVTSLTDWRWRAVSRLTGLVLKTYVDRECAPQRDQHAWNGDDISDYSSHECRLRRFPA